MIAITGACGFIGSVLVKTLNDNGMKDLLLVDNFEIDQRVGYAYNPRYEYLNGKKFNNIWNIDFDENRIFNNRDIEFIFHLGAISDTLESDLLKIRKFNVEYTKILGRFASKKNIPVVFASSAAVYGNGSGPLNPYAASKLECEEILKDIACSFRIFNVYGPNEYHKKNMSSVILKWHRERLEDGCINLFDNSRSYLRDFIYVGDVCNVMLNCYNNHQKGIFDLGTGNQLSFEELAHVYIGINSANIRSVGIPDKLKAQYQVNTVANTEGIVGNGWDVDFLKVQDGVAKYCEFLNNGEKVL